MDEDLEITSETSHSDYINRLVKTEEYIHTLKLLDFKTRYNNSLQRRRHQIHNEGESTAWRITIFTDNSDEAFKDYLSLECLFQKVTLNIENDPNFIGIFLINKYGKEQEIYSKLLNTSEEDEDEDCYWVIKKFVKKKYVFDEKNGFLPNDSLTIRFKIYFPFEEVEEDGATEPKRPNFIGFENLLNNEEFSDVKIAIDDKILYANRCIIASQSQVFQAMFSHDMKETNDNILQITDVTYEVMQELLRFLYAGKVNNVEDVAVDLFIAADKYQLTHLKTLCERTMINDLSIETVTSFLNLAEKYESKMLKEKALKFFQLHAKDIVQTEKYRTDMSSLPPVLLADIIKSLVMYK